MQTMKHHQSNNPPVDDADRVRRASEASSGANDIPNPVSSKPDRRQFTAAYKLSIVQCADTCQNPGEIGELLRQEGLYSSHLSNWRKLHRQGALDSLHSQPRGPKSDPNRQAQAEIVRLEKHIEKLKDELDKAHTIIDVQIKLSSLLSKMPNNDPSS